MDRFAILSLGVLIFACFVLSSVFGSDHGMVAVGMKGRDLRLE
jgi:hypothetical protein